VAVFARLVASNCHARFSTEECFLKLQGQVFPQVSAALHPAAATPGAASAEHIAETEKFSEDVAEILEDGGIETGAGAASTAQSGMAVTVVNGALVSIGEHGISLTNFLKFFFRVRIVGIAVRMELQRQLSICALQFDFRDGAANTQHFVVVAFCVRGQNETFL
jgi:hypothetical protein